MIVSVPKPMEEVMNLLKDENSIFLVGCKGCAESCKTGGQEAVEKMEKTLIEAGKKITGYSLIDFVCDKALVKLRLTSYTNKIKESDALLIMSCGIGVQAAANSVNKACYPASNTVSLGGRLGEWRGEERCGECGDCKLWLTAGICPMTKCTKSLLNGPCGGSQDGKCEFEPDNRDCGWHLIYERLKELNRLDNLKKYLPPNDYRKSQPPVEFRETIFWSLDQTKKGGAK
ncbi:methylenetetrahydrofolate reductase C-terminal domain-containing protein [bacterium]|nr:methylenetetrahydrofolate reductase C-terminal domain-containing protein [bacterium]